MNEISRLAILGARVQRSTTGATCTLFGRTSLFEKLEYRLLVVGMPSLTIDVSVLCLLFESFSSANLEEKAEAACIVLMA
jgi:hypothetical protein